MAFLDSDNRWESFHLETVASLLVRFPEAVLASAQPRTDRRGEWVDSVPFDALPTLLNANIVGRITSCAVLRRALAEAGGFDERIVAAEDYELWLRLALQGPFVFTVRSTLAGVGDRED